MYRKIRMISVHTEKGEPMAKFIEVHKAGKPELINLDHVACVGENGIVGVDRKLFHPDEDYQKLRMLIAAAQGGIPMERSGMY